MEKVKFELEDGNEVEFFAGVVIFNRHISVFPLFLSPENLFIILLQKNIARYGHIKNLLKLIAIY